MQVITDHPTRWVAKTGKSVEPLSEGFERMLNLDSGFQKWGGREDRFFIAVIVFFVALDLKQLFGERMFLHFLIQEIL